MTDQRTTFYGPWTIITVRPVAYLGLWHVEFYGTDGGDGRYALQDGRPMEWSLEGTEWKLTVLTLLPAPTSVPSLTLQPVTPSRTTYFQHDVGLVVDVTASSLDTVTGPRLLLRCVSNDPHITPITGGPPFDFTIPET